MSLQPRREDSRDRVGPYVLVKAIGAGGSARVDLARIERAYGFQRHVVIKRPLEHLRSDARAAESIRREARLGARLRHPNLVAILDAGVHDGYDYLVLDYVHGGSLRDLMQTEEGARVRDVSLDVSLAIVRDVARGLHEAHELHDDRGGPLGLVHRDVSPGNVLIGLDGAVKLADFGIAKETRVATLSGSMHGTVTYMAPEQCRGHAFDRRADVFSLGVILYELVTGTRLFWADNDVASLHRVLAGTVTRPRKLRPGIAPDLEDIIMTAVAHDQDKRFPTARALAEAIEIYGTGAGLLLAARCVSRWTHEILGPRDAPWIGDETVVNVAPVFPDPYRPDETLPASSLVELIEAAPPVEEPLLPTFGPTDAAVAEDGPALSHAAPVAVRPRNRRTAVIALIGAAALGGLVAAVLTGGREDARDKAVAPPPASETAAPVAEPEEPAGVADPPTIEIEEDDVVADEPAAPGTPPRKKKKRRRTTAATKAAGSGSATAKGTPNAEWDPGMLLPTDQKK